MVESAQAVEDMKKKGVTVVYFGAEDEDYQTFLKVAAAFEDVAFAHSFDEALKAEMKGAKVTLFKNFDEERNDYVEEMDMDQLTQFIEVNSVKTIMDFDQKAAEVIFSNAKDALFALYSKEDESSKKMLDLLESVSKSLKGKVVMSTSNVSDGLGSRLGEFLGYEANQAPNFMMITFQEEDVAKFVFEGEMTAENLTKFVDDVLEGKVKPFLKSEPVPEK